MRIDCIKGPAITMDGVKYTAAIVPEHEMHSGRYQGPQVEVDSYCRYGHMKFAQTCFAESNDDVYVAFVPFPRVKTERAPWMRDNHGYMNKLSPKEFCAQCFGRSALDMDDDERAADEFSNLFNGDYDEARDSYDTGLFFGGAVEKWFKKAVMECFGP